MFVLFVCFAAGLLAAAVTAQSGRMPTAPRVLWRLDKPNFHHQLPVMRGLVYAGGPDLTAHRVTTGEEVHRAPLAGPWRHPVLGGGILFVRHGDGTLHAFVADLSRSLWNVELLSSRWAGTAHGDMFFVTSGTKVLAITGGKVHWSFDVGSGVAMKPATDGRRVYVAGAAGVVVAIDVHSGDEVWRYTNNAEFGSTSPTVRDGVLVLADRGIGGGRKAACNAFDATTGELLWETQFGSTGFSRPHIDDGRVWAGFGVRVAAFDIATGRLDLENAIRTGRNPFGMPGTAGDAIVFGNLDGNLYVHDRRSGALRWRFEANGKAQVGGWGLHDGIVLVGTTDGLYAIGETANAAPVPAGFVLKP